MALARAMARATWPRANVDRQRITMAAANDGQKKSG
jgi:hypothetical protein